MSGKHLRRRSISAEKTSPPRIWEIGKWISFRFERLIDFLEDNLSSYRYINGIVGIFMYLTVTIFFAMSCLDDGVFKSERLSDDLPIALKMFGDAIVPTTITYVSGICTQGLLLLRDRESNSIAVIVLFLNMSVFYAMLYVLSRKMNSVGFMFVTNVVLTFIFAKCAVYALPPGEN